MRKSHRTITITRHQDDKQSKATSSPFPIKMIAKLEQTQSNAQQHMEQTQNPTNGSSNNQQQQNRHHRMDSSLSHCALNAFYWYQIFALDSVFFFFLNTKFVKLAWRLPNYRNVSLQRNHIIKLTHYD